MGLEKMYGRQGTVVIESAAAEDGKPVGVRSVESEQTRGSLPNHGRQLGDERPIVVSAESRNAFSPSRVVLAVIGYFSAVAPSVSISTLETK
ncbi:hypothetical protein LCGC14_2439670 [marine sediment metagenome]|uniref:Uncharacterized protein n=1 Tax=marine sediment metagenome TaxID=412755 RepID=A0A0F9EDB4_9ZZZZ